MGKINQKSKRGILGIFPGSWPSCSFGYIKTIFVLQFYIQKNFNQNVFSEEINSSSEYNDSETGLKIDPQLAKKRRTLFSSQQINELERAFEKSDTPDINTRQELAQRTQLTEDIVRTWFNNKRYRLKKKLEKKHNNVENRQVSRKIGKVHNTPAASAGPLRHLQSASNKISSPRSHQILSSSNGTG